MGNPGTHAQLTYPRQEALTRRFRLGVPRGFVVSEDGTQALFIRSSSGRDAAGSLWLVDEHGSEHCIADARVLHRDDADLPDAERARRERLREVTSGITAFSVSRDFARVAFSIDGTLYCARVDAAGEPVALPAPQGVVDPRISPDGSLVAFSYERQLGVVAADASGDWRVLAAPDNDDQCWGLADFIAAEELERHRGLWWAPDSTTVIAELADESDVALQWISDPAHPTSEPRTHRYPAAGTANPQARLFRIALDGTRQEIPWPREQYPYLATVHAGHDSGAVVSVLSRDQSRQLILLAPHDGSPARELRLRETQPWVTVQPGVPALDDTGALLEIVADLDADSFRLVRDGQPLTPPGVQVNGVVHHDARGTLVTASEHPAEQHLARIGTDGTCTWLTHGPGVNSAVASDHGMVVVSVSDDWPGARAAFQGPQSSTAIASAAEEPIVTPTVRFHSVGDIDFAVLLPTSHVAGSRLPVVMAPYAGPHHSRVVHASNAFASDQWLADQGFAVVVVDGAGTPGRGPRREFAVHLDLATDVLADQVAGLQEAARLYPDLDLARVGITGWSFGGYLAALAVLDRPDVFHAAVAGAPVTEWRLYDTAYTERYLGLPQEHPEAYDGSSLLPRADRLRRPLLFIHGLADDNVVAAHTLQMSSALLAAGKPHTVLPLSGVTHMTPQEVVAENLLLLEVDFLRTHLQI